LSTDHAAETAPPKVEFPSSSPEGHEHCFGSEPMNTTLVGAIRGMDDRGYIYIEYLTVLIALGLVSAAAMLAILPSVYENHFDSVSILLSIKP
jgi:hypothetical protein